MREECPQYSLQFGRWFATCAFPETPLRAEMRPAMLRVRMFDLHYILCYIEKLSCQETWWAPGDMMSKKAACFAVEINIKCPHSSGRETLGLVVGGSSDTVGVRMHSACIARGVLSDPETVLGFLQVYLAVMCWLAVPHCLLLPRKLCLSTCSSQCVARCRLQISLLMCVG